MPETILFVCRPEPGHLLPTIPVARRVSADGYRVVFLTAGEFGARLAQQGFEVESFDEDYRTSEGVRPMYWTERCVDDVFKDVMRGRSETFDRFVGARIHEVAAKHNARAVVADRYFVQQYYAAFDCIEEHVPLVWLWNTLPQWTEPFPLVKTTQIMLCPIEFELPQFRMSHGKLHYVEPSIDLERSEAPFDWSKIDCGKPLIVCSFGTQTARHREMDERMRAVLEAARSLGEFQFVVALGQSKSTAQLFEEIAPPNAYAAPAIPLLQLLKRAALLVTHGGLGSIKEALYFGVPMLVIPFAHDQPFNAIRVRNFGIGDCLRKFEIRAEEIASRIATLVTDSDVARRVAVFRDIFQERHQRHDAAALIEAEVQKYIRQPQTRLADVLR